jgi:carbonic anhydrase
MRREKLGGVSELSEFNRTEKPKVNRRQAVRLAALGMGGAVVAGAAMQMGFASAEEEPEEWAYNGDLGPEHWGELSEGFLPCAIGEEQSPINVTNATAEDLGNIEFSYTAASPLQVVNLGHTVQVLFPAGNTILVDGVTYELKQFHFHTPSEHTIDGKESEMEMHMVHISAEGGIAVVGVMLNQGAENEALANVFHAMPVMEGPAQTVTGSIDPNEVLPETRTTYRYNGSLTTPPCTEGVKWLLMTEPAEVSSEQYKAFAKIVKVNSRPVQPLNDRTLVEDSTP